MKKITLFILIAAMVLTMLAGCGKTDGAAPMGKAEESTTGAAETPVPDSTQDILAPATADELREKISLYRSEGDYEAVYETAMRLIELDPSDAQAYIDAASALAELSKANYEEIDRLMALGAENLQDTHALSDWAEQNQPDISFQIPFSPDYSSADEINTEGITTGNLTNAAKYRYDWWQCGSLTWQGDWVYLVQPGENFAIYKVRSDGSGYQHLGEACGECLNVIGDWIYYLNIDDGCPYKMRTDGSMNTRLSDEGCSFLSVSGDWMYFFGDKLYKIRTDGSEKTALTEDFTIFPCVAGEWVYYCVKSEEGGLWRVSVDGGKPQQIAPGFMQYCVVDDWVYYVDQNNWNTVLRVHPDGSGAEQVIALDSRITTFNVAGDVIYLSIDVSNEEQDGFIVGVSIVAIDIETGEKLLSADADTEPLCTGPDGMVYFFKYSEGMAWYSMDKDGNVAKIE